MTDEQMIDPYDVMSSGWYEMKMLSITMGGLSVDRFLDTLCDRMGIETNTAEWADLINATNKLICWFAVNQVIEIKENDQALMDYLYGDIETNMWQVVFTVNPFWCIHGDEIKDLVSCYYKNDPKANVMKEWLKFNSVYAEEYAEFFQY
jgi:hypothetical protein